MEKNKNSFFMQHAASEFLRSLYSRDYIHQITDGAGLDALAQQGGLCGYIGFDATADSLHVGNLVGIMLLRRLQQAGGRPIVLMGGGTTKVGDPSGKDAVRQLLDDEKINHNIASIKGIFSNYLRFDDSPSGAIMVNNADWLDRLEYITFLREVGRHFTINRMLTFDSVRTRLEREQPLSFLEFNYMLMQAYDFVELSKRHGCRLQMGGSDQWGNIVNGTDLGGKMGTPPLYGLTSPLITTASGAKMGKSVSGAVWLKPEKLSPYDYWQFWRNTEDADVARFMRLFTDLPLAEIDRYAALAGAEINEAKKMLAFEATKLCHGEAAAHAAAQTAQATFEAGGVGEALPSVTFSRAALQQGVPLLAVLVQTGLAPSKGEARRLIEGGGAKINGHSVTDANAMLDDSAANPEGVIKLSAGKKRHALVKVVLYQRP